VFKKHNVWIPFFLAALCLQIIVCSGAISLIYTFSDVSQPNNCRCVYCGKEFYAHGKYKRENYRSLSETHVRCPGCGVTSDLFTLREHYKNPPREHKWDFER